MIKIKIENESDFKREFFNRFSPLVLERIQLYKDFFKWINKTGTLAAVKRKQPEKRTRRIMINKLRKGYKFETEETLFAFDFSRGLKPRTIQKLIDFLDNISNELEIILTGNIDELIDVHSRIVNFNKSTFPIAKNMCSMIFDYEAFSKEENETWGYGAQYAHKLNLNVCPYCNRNFITTVTNNDTEEKVIGPTFDHFLPKHKYPLFNISIFNLIPSCTICNSNLKHKVEFDNEFFLYPFQDEFGNDLFFDFIFKEFDINNITSPLNYHIFLSPQQIIPEKKRKKLFGDKVSAKRGSLNIFKTEEIYRKSHADIVGELAVKCDKNNRLYARSILNLMGNKIGLKEFYQFYFGNYLNKKDWNRRPLAKLTYDIISKRLPEFALLNNEETF